MQFQVLMSVGIFALIVIILLMSFYKKYKYSKKELVFVGIILILGFIIRICSLDSGMGLTGDEAMAGYDVWSLIHYGVDGNLVKNPVYFIAWGSGQSSLYNYICMPFIKYMGLNLFSLRLPMALISCFTLIFYLYTLYKIKISSFFRIILLITYVFNPWHIMLSRRAMDCNVMPNFLLISICCFILLVHTVSVKKKWIYLIIGNLFFVLGLYSYAVSWFVLPILYFLFLFFSYRKKWLTQLQLGVSILITFFISLPLLLFVKINFIGGESFKFGFLTITKLLEARSNTTMILGKEHLPLQVMKNVSKLFAMYFYNSDTSFANVIPFFGLFYPFYFIFIIIGFFVYFKKRDFLSDIMFAWGASCIFIILFVIPGYNRFNSLHYPLIYFGAKGIYETFKSISVLRRGVLTVYFVYFFMFVYNYFYRYETRVLQEGVGVISSIYLKDAIDFAKTKKYDKICIPNTNFAVVLFYDPVDPHYFNRTKENLGPTSIRMFSYYGNYDFREMSETHLSNNNIYILTQTQLNACNTKMMLSGYKNKIFGNLFVFYK